MSAHPHTQYYEQPKHSIGEFVRSSVLNGTVMGMELAQVTGLLRYQIEDCHGNRHWVYADEITEQVRYLGIHNEGHDDNG